MSIEGSNTYTSDRVRYSSDADFYTDNGPTLQEIDYLSIVSCTYIQIDTSHYHYFLEDPNSCIDEGTNYDLTLGSNTHYVGFTETISVPNIIDITSISSDSTISSANSLQVDYSNSSNEYASILITQISDINSTATFSQYQKFFTDDGSYTVPTTVLVALNEGHYQLSVKNYDPVFITMSDGRKVCVLYVTRHTIPIYIEH